MGETIPGYVAATVESVKVNILEEVNAAIIYHTSCCCCVIYTQSIFPCREMTHDSSRGQYLMVGSTILIMINFLSTIHSSGVIVCTCLWMCMQNLLLPPFCVCRSCTAEEEEEEEEEEKEEEEEEEEEKQEETKEQKWWVC